MITKFKKIKNLAVYQNLDWDSSMRDKGNNVINFSLINIIYGRNYSGKTTLSRIVRSLETGYISDKYENPEFTITFSDNADSSESNLIGHNKKIRVFNEDFVKDNLRFIVNPEENIIPFAILGESGTLQEEIDKLKLKLGDKILDEETGLYKVTGLYLDLKNSTDLTSTAQGNFDKAFKDFDNKLTQKATNRNYGIKYKSEIYGDQNYTKTKLENHIKEVLKSSFVAINDLEKNRLLKLLNENTLPTVEKYVILNFDFQNLSNKTRTLVTKKIGDSNKIEQLIKDSILNRWVSEGRLLHKDKLEDCTFCGGKISSERWLELDKHFDEESTELEKNIGELINNINLEIEKLRSNPQINKNLFYSKFHPKLEKLNLLKIKLIEKYISSLNNIKEQLENRSKDLINAKNFIDNVDYTCRLNYLSDIFENIRVINNESSVTLSSEQTEAKNKLLLKEVKDYLDIIQYVEENKSLQLLKSKFEEENEKEKNIVIEIEKYSNLIEEKKRLMNDEEKGAIKVNEYLNNFFGHNFLSLQAVDENSESNNIKKIKFEIIRNGKKAHHLSEGESSLIAFCYFMAKLDDINTKDSKPIIWIDDPISSLDTNHIFFVYSLINSEIVSKKNFEQIFLSTHNLDFLKYLKQLPGAKHKSESRYFIIAREGDISKIKQMPKYLKDYVTEFNFLFHQIYLCANADTDDETQHTLYYNFANNTRKFLEAFLFYKYPNGIENEDKLSRFFGDDVQASSMINRINNEYSHLEGLFERSMVPIDVPEMKKTANFLLSKIEEKDIDQYNSLLKSIGIDD